MNILKSTKLSLVTILQEEAFLHILVMGPSQKILTWGGSSQFFVAGVGSAIFGLGLENFPLKMPNFSFFFL